MSDAGGGHRYPTTPRDQRAYAGVPADHLISGYPGIHKAVTAAMATDPDAIEHIVVLVQVGGADPGWRTIYCCDGTRAAGGQLFHYLADAHDARRRAKPF